MISKIKTQTLFKAFSALSLSWTLVACHQFDANRAGIDPRAEVQAPSAVGDSFVVSTAGGDLGVNKNLAQITLKKAALEKEFLLMGSLIQQQPIPSFNGLKSRVVAFRLANNNLYLLDANSGHQIDNNLPQNLLLAQFPIISQDSQSITFDFNAGMSSIFTEGDWYSENDPGGSNYNYKLDHAKVLLSYISGARLSAASNTLVIEQIAQVQTPGAAPGSFDTSPVAAKYYLSPYLPDAGFTPMASEGFKSYGYFEVSPQLADDGSSFVRVSKWDVRSPITYAISANTPAEFRQPISDAVLYWNHIVGKDILKVVQLTDMKITAPDPEYNIIQWVENKAAGFAYADAQMDPRSGQILHAQIYMTSVFGDLGKIRAEKDIRDDAQNQATQSVKLSLQGFEGSSSSSIFCRYESGRAMKTFEQTLSANGGPGSITKAQALKIAQDYVRETVNHEVGHTLGLRHNFAGSLATNIVLSKRADVYHQYLQSGHALDTTRTTSSIMDYELFEESTLMGDQISRGVGDLAYDRQALQHLYLGQQFPTSPAFCTDEDINKYQDCQTFDNGQSLLEASSWALGQALDRVALNLVNTYITNKVPNDKSTPTKPVEKVSLNPLGYAITQFAPRFKQYQGFTKAGALVAVQSQYPFISSLNAEIVKSAEDDYLRTTAQALGGLNTLFSPIDDGFSAAAYTKFSALLDNPAYASGTVNGVPYAFSDAEKAVMRTNAKLYMDRLQTYLVKLDLVSLSGNPSPKDPAAVKDPNDDAPPADPAIPAPLDLGLSQDLLPIISDRIDRYVFPTVSTGALTGQISLQPDPDAKPTDPAKTVNVNLPQFKYPFETRLAAAKLLAKGHSADAAWGMVERAKYTKQLSALIEKSLGTTLDKVDVTSLNHDLAEWILQNQAVLTTLSGDSGN